MAKVFELKDIANVYDTLKDRSTIERINSGKGVRLLVMKQSGTNTVKIAEKVKKELERIKKTLPSDIQIKEVFDTSRNILNSINNLTETIILVISIFVSLGIILFGALASNFLLFPVIPISLMSGFIYLFIANDQVYYYQFFLQSL